MSDIDTDLCGHPTTGGKPCNMRKGHPAPFHRYREYRPPAIWCIKDASTLKVVESGEGRVPLSYAIGRVIVNHPNIIIELNTDPSDSASAPELA